MKVMDVLRDFEPASVVAVVRYVPAERVGSSVYQGCPPPQNPAVYLQVTLRAEKLSQSKKLIRLGDTKGDEIFGWQNLEALDVVEVLGVLAVDGATVLPVSRETEKVA